MDREQKKLLEAYEIVKRLAALWQQDSPTISHSIPDALIMFGRYSIVGEQAAKLVEEENETQNHC